MALGDDVPVQPLAGMVQTRDCRGRYPVDNLGPSSTEKSGSAEFEYGEEFASHIAAVP